MGNRLQILEENILGDMSHAVKGGGAGEGDGADWDPDWTLAGATVSVFRREGESDAEDYAGGDEGAGGAVEYENGNSGVRRTR